MAVPAEPADDGVRDLAEQVVLAAVGAVSLTAERVDSLADDLAERGGMRRDDARALARDLASRWRGDSIRVSERAGSSIQGALKQFGLSRESLGGLKKNDERKLAIARVIRRRTTVANSWLARELELGHVSAVSRCLKGSGESSQLEAEIITILQEMK